LVQLTNRPGSDGEPAWLPDGRLVFTSWVGGVPALRWLDPDEPDVVYEIVIDPGEARRASGVFD
jgi:Tol biopolymer transport system component